MSRDLIDRIAEMLEQADGYLPGERLFSPEQKRLVGLEKKLPEFTKLYCGLHNNTRDPYLNGFTPNEWQPRNWLLRNPFVYEAMDEYPAAGILPQ